jgi:hypothetical protein
MPLLLGRQAAPFTLFRPLPGQVVAEAWSVVDATYVDRTFNNNDWFKIRQDVVKRK